MKGTLTLITLSLLLIGCGSTTVKPPTIHHTAELEQLSVPIINVEPLPKSPVAVPVTIVTEEGSISGAGFTLEGMQELKQLRTVAKKNTAILAELVAGNKALIAERNAIVMIAREEERRANVLAEEWARAEEGRRHEEKMRVIERWFYQALFVLGVIVAL